ncbi:hypothetical protein L218DRAFT_990535 [Marasmius fiardii PR-910]|nr:hypothetical protein L218DRAFT_990535 [Marasmius fiardii PR-910]
MASNADDIAQLVALYLTVENVIILPVSTLSTMFVIYEWTISLFVLATLYTASYVFGLSHQATIDFNTAITKNYKPILKYFFGKDDGKAAWSFISNFASSFMGAIADWMLGFLLDLLLLTLLGTAPAKITMKSIPKPQ